MTSVELKKRPRKFLLAAVPTLLLLLVAALLYFSRDQEATLALPVRFTGISDELLVVGKAPVLDVRLRGGSRLVNSLKDLELIHKIDLASAKPGTILVKVAPETIQLPSRVSVLEVHPASFAVSIDKRGQKLMPIEPDLQNDPAAGHIVSRVVTSPSAIKLTGPSKVLEGLSAVRTTPVDLAGLTESTKKKVALNLNHSPSVSPVEDSLIEVEIVIEEDVTETWMDIRVQGTSTKYRYEITPEQIRLLLKGPVNTLKKLAQGNAIRVYVDLKGIKPGTYIHPAVIEPPLNITLLQAKPDVFTVHVFE